MSEPSGGFRCGPDGCRQLTQFETKLILDGIAEAKAKRASDLPDERAALQALMQAYQRLTELGWQDATYAPKNVDLEMIEVGSTGIHQGSRDVEGRFWIFDGDTWPSRPSLFRLKHPTPHAGEGR